MAKPTEEERARARWSQVLAFDHEQTRVIESLRYRDQDHHVKSGAILGFSGLLIASDLVQLSASCGTIAYMSPTSEWLPIARIALIVLMSSAALSLVSISYGRLRRYADDPWRALNQFGDMVNLRSAIEIVAIWLCAGGALASLSSLLATLFLGLQHRCG